MGETRVDLLHLLEDLRDAYPGALEETILTEIVANALDSGAARIAIVTDAAAAAFTVVDDGSGMKRRELARYHDVAASAKVRGEGIGFAGVGIKLGLLASEEVLTETRRGKTHVATSWRLASRQRAPWRWVPPPGQVPGHGTAVRLALTNPLSPLLDAGFVAACLERTFEPLLDPTFDDCLRPHYGTGIAFVVNDRELVRRERDTTRVRLAVRLARKRKPSAIGYLRREAARLPEAEQGLAVSTLGKIIKRGWDWLGLAPASPELVGGVIEVPALAACLTLNKAEFIRTGPRGATYLAYRKAIQEAVAAQLAAWGDTRDPSVDARRRARPVERDLQKILVDLAETFPLLAALVERQAGGQARLPSGRAAVRRETPDLVVGESPAVHEPGAAEPGSARARPPESEAERAAAPPAEPPGSAAGGPRRPARYGLSIQFESRLGDPELGRLVESTVWVNEAHPAYRRAVASRSEGYHLALTVAMALAPLAVEPKDAQAFITTFLARWGEALDRRITGRRRRG